MPEPGRSTAGTIRRASVGAVVVAALIVPTAAGAAPARHGGHRRDPRFECNLSVTRLGDDLNVTFLMRSQVAHQTWHVRLWDNDIRFFSKDRTTNHDGKFKVVRPTENQHGHDLIRARAVSVETEKVCAVHVEL